MKSFFLLSITAMLLGLAGLAHGQKLPCGTPPVDVSDPDHQAFAQAMQSYSRKVNAPVRVIPVVFHIVSESATNAANISQAQINSAITVLNEAFRGVYGGVDTEIEFCLAGVNRIQHPIHFTVELGLNDDLVKALSQEDPNSYLNIWTVNALFDDMQNPIGGFTIYPKFLTTFPQLDGVLIDHRYVGAVGTAANNDDFNLGRALVDEVGHWLNVFHVFESGCDDNWTCGFMGDCCCDTPPQMKQFPNCKKNKNSCHGDSPDLKDPVQNFMGYSDDDCRIEFTACQAGRMHLTLDSLRPNAWFVQGGDCPVLRLGGTGDADLEATVVVYPNPVTSNSVIEVQLPRMEVVSMELFDVQGRLVERVYGAEVVKKGTLTRPFPATLVRGRYFLRVKIGEEMMVKKIFAL